MSPHQKAEIYKLLRELVRLRDGGACLRCGRTEQIQLSHIYPKGTHRKMELEPENLKFLCLKCHLFFWHKSPVEAWEWLEKTVDRGRLNRLKLQANTINKNQMDPKLYILWLKTEIQKYDRAGVQRQN